MTKHSRYREFIAQLESTAAENDGIRVLENRTLAETCEAWLSIVPGRDGGIAIVTTPRGKTPTSVVAVKIDPTATRLALAAALSTDRMMRLAKTLLTPGNSDLLAAADFAEGLSTLDTNPLTDESLPPVTKPPSLDAALWKQIPHALRRDYFKKMAWGLRRGVHPDDTVAELLAAA